MLSMTDLKRSELDWIQKYRHDVFGQSFWTRRNSHMDQGSTLFDSLFPSLYDGIRKGRYHWLADPLSHFEIIDIRSHEPSSEVRVIPITVEHVPGQHQFCSSEIEKYQVHSPGKTQVRNLEKHKLHGSESRKYHTHSSDPKKYHQVHSLQPEKYQVQGNTRFLLLNGSQEQNKTERPESTLFSANHEDLSLSDSVASKPFKDLQISDPNPDYFMPESLSRSDSHEKLMFGSSSLITDRSKLDLYESKSSGGFTEDLKSGSHKGKFNQKSTSTVTDNLKFESRYNLGLSNMTTDCLKLDSPERLSILKSSNVTPERLQSDSPERNPILGPSRVIRHNPNLDSNNNSSVSSKYLAIKDKEEGDDSEEVDDPNSTSSSEACSSNRSNLMRCEDQKKHKMKSSSKQAYKNETNDKSEFKKIRVPPQDMYVYKRLKAKLALEDRKIDYIEGDGNCFFRAVSKGHYGSERHHMTARTQIVNLMAKNKPLFAPFVDKEDVEGHLEKMSKEHSWATTAEIYAAATLLQKMIFMLVPDHNDIYGWVLFKPLFVMKAEVSEFVDSLCYITMCNTDGIHYDRVVPVHENCNCFLPMPVLLSGGSSGNPV